MVGLILLILVSIVLLVILVFAIHESSEPQLASLACLATLFLTIVGSLAIVTDGTVVNVCEENGVYEVIYTTKL